MYHSALLKNINMSFIDKSDMDINVHDVSSYSPSMTKFKHTISERLTHSNMYFLHKINRDGVFIIPNNFCDYFDYCILKCPSTIISVVLYVGDNIIKNYNREQFLLFNEIIDHNDECIQIKTEIFTPLITHNEFRLEINSGTISNKFQYEMLVECYKLTKDEGTRFLNTQSEIPMHVPVKLIDPICEINNNVYTIDMSNLNCSCANIIFITDKLCRCVDFDGMNMINLKNNKFANYIKKYSADVLFSQDENKFIYFLQCSDHENKYSKCGKYTVGKNKFITFEPIGHGNINFEVHINYLSLLQKNEFMSCYKFIENKNNYPLTKENDIFIEGYWQCNLKNLNYSDKYPFPKQETMKIDNIFLDKLKNIFNVIEETTEDKYSNDKYSNCDGWNTCVSNLGSSYCRLCKKDNGNIEYKLLYDGIKFIVPSGIIHYYEDHNVHPSNEFYNFIINYDTSILTTQLCF